MTPTSYLELISCFKQLLDMKRQVGAHKSTLKMAALAAPKKRMSAHSLSAAYAALSPKLEQTTSEDTGGPVHTTACIPTEHPALL